MLAAAVRAKVESTGKTTPVPDIEDLKCIEIEFKT